MSKNIELYLNTDKNESFSLESNDSNTKEVEEIETEEEKKNRISVQNALKYNNSAHAFEIINSKITSFCSNIQILQDYSLTLGSKLDNKQKGEDIEKIIIETGDEISETFILIEIVKNFEYNDRNQKIQNIKQANNLEDKCNKYKEKFDNLINEIKKQNLNLIRQARNSIRYSNFSDFSGEIHLDNETPKKDNNNNNNNNEMNSEKKYLINIEMKKKQNNAIIKAARKMERSLSRRLTSIRVNTDNDNDNNSLENFNIDYNYKKNNESPGEGSKVFSNPMVTKKSSSILRDMEKKVFIALEGQNQSFIRKYWVFILIVFMVFLVIIYYILCIRGK